MSSLVVAVELSQDDPVPQGDDADDDRTGTWKTVPDNRLIKNTSLLDDVETSDNNSIDSNSNSPKTTSSRKGISSPISRSRTTSADVINMYGGIIIPTNYDYSKSTEDNYALESTTLNLSIPSPVSPLFVGKYKDQRSTLDYTYHRHYSPERQLFHDRMIDMFHNTRIVDTDNNLVCDRPLENWIVFTAGPMGAGKGHTMQWLHREELFPLPAFVKVDPDSLRELLPETPEYILRNPSTAGRLTQKEVGYVAEVLTLDALQQGKNVLVDGSLKDAEWYLQYIQLLRQQFPRLKIAILHVKAHEDTVLARCRRRAEATGRVVPEEIIISSMHAIPNTLRILAPKVDYFATFENEDDSNEPRLLMASKAVSSDDLAALLDEDMSKLANAASFSGHSASAVAAEAVSIKKEEYSTTYSTDATWRGKFMAVWKMECARPDFSGNKKTSNGAGLSSKNEL